jgi:hypothetical protein
MTILWLQNFIAIRLWLLVILAAAFVAGGTAVTVIVLANKP